MNPYDYQQALSLAGGSAAGADVTALQKEVVAAATPRAPIDPDAVMRLEDEWAKSNFEKRSDWNLAHPENLITANPVAINVTPAQVSPYVPGTPPTTTPVDVNSIAPINFDTAGSDLLPVAAIGGVSGAIAGLAGVWDEVTGMLPESWGGFLGAVGTGLGLYNLISGAVSGGGGASEVTNVGGINMASGTQVVTVNGGTAVGGVSFGGPGVPEPPAAMVAKAWKTKSFSNTVGEYWVYFWKLTDGRILCWNAAKREAKIWRPKKPIVMYRGKVTLSQAVKTQRMLDKLWRTVAKKTKQLKLA